MHNTDVLPDNIPDELKEIPRWICWTWEKEDENWRKPPISCLTGRKVDVNDSAAWATFDKALTYYCEHGLAGVGFVLIGDGYCGVDLDDCRDPGTGDLDSWADEIVAQLDSYTEISPSGTGVKVFVRGLLPEKRLKKEKIEFYSGGQYFTVTGRHLPETSPSVENRQPDLLRLYHALLGVQPVLSDEKLLSLARRAKNGQTFIDLWTGAEALWQGDNKQYGSQSEADLALCGILAFWTQGDPKRVEDLFSRSGLASREKWGRQDYREATIRQALAGLTGVYHPTSSRQVSTMKLPPGKHIIGQITFGESPSTTVEEAENKQEGGQDDTTGQVSTRFYQVPLSSTRVNNTGGRVCSAQQFEQGMQWAMELADKIADLPEWDVTFRLARVLRRLADDHPEQFEQIVRAFCQKTGRSLEGPDWEGFYYDFLVVFEKVKLAAGDDPVEWAVEEAERNPYPFPCSPGVIYSAVASLSWHLSQMRRDKPFWLSQTLLANLYTKRMGKAVPARYISRAIHLLKRNNIIECVDEHYQKPGEGKKPKAKKYVFIGPDPCQSLSTELIPPSDN